MPMLKSEEENKPKVEVDDFSLKLLSVFQDMETLKTALESYALGVMDDGRKAKDALNQCKPNFSWLMEQSKKRTIDE